MEPGDPCTPIKPIDPEEAALNQIADDIETAKNRFGSDRIGICVGSCDNGTEFSVAGHKKYFETNHFPQDYNLEIQGADYVSTYIAEKFDIKGPANTFSTACSSMVLGGQGIHMEQTSHL